MVAKSFERLLNTFSNLFALVVDQALNEKFFKVFVVIELTHEYFWIPEDAGEEKVQTILDELRYRVFSSVSLVVRFEKSC